MPKPRRVPDVQKRLRHLSECQVHAQNAIKLEVAGKVKEARAAVKKAERCMHRYMRETGEI